MPMPLLVSCAMCEKEAKVTGDDKNVIIQSESRPVGRSLNPKTPERGREDPVSLLDWQNAGEQESKPEGNNEIGQKMRDWQSWLLTVLEEHQRCITQIISSQFEAFHHAGGNRLRIDSTRSNASGRQNSTRDERNDFEKPREMRSSCSLGTRKSRNEELTALEYDLKEEWKLSVHAHVLARPELQLVQKSESRSSKLNLGSSGQAGQAEAFGYWYTHEEQVHGFARYFVSAPTNPKRITWELCGIAIILYDIIAIPLLTAFDLPATDFIDAVNWIGLVFWSLNIPVALTTGFIDHGILILNMRYIFVQYSRTWLAVDVLTLVPDWFFKLSSQGHDRNRNDESSFVKLPRIIRLMRLARLARFVKLKNIWMLLVEMVDSEKIGILFNVLKMILLLVLVNHYVACMWFVVGTSEKNRSWVTANGFEHNANRWQEKYMVAFHWSVTQFTPSSMNVQPVSLRERTFAISIVLFGLVGFSYLVGNITGSLTRLRAIDEQRTSQFWMLRKFLKRNHVSLTLSERIKVYVESRWEHQQNHLKAKDVEVLSLLSDSLKADLGSELYGPLLRIHPLFDSLQEKCPMMIRRLASSGLSQQSLAPQDVMVHAGEEANHMSIVTDGMLEYHGIHNDEPQVVEFGQDWIAEPVLWVKQWFHLGDVKAVQSTELLKVYPEVLIEKVSLYPTAFRAVSSYAQEYYTWLRGLHYQSISDLSHRQPTEDWFRSVTEFSTTRSRRSVNLVAERFCGTTSGLRRKQHHEALVLKPV